MWIEYVDQHLEWESSIASFRPVFLNSAGTIDLCHLRKTGIDVFCRLKLACCFSSTRHRPACNHSAPFHHNISHPLPHPAQTHVLGHQHMSKSMEAWFRKLEKRFTALSKLNGVYMFVQSVRGGCSGRFDVHADRCDGACAEAPQVPGPGGCCSHLPPAARHVLVSLPWPQAGAIPAPGEHPP